MGGHPAWLHTLAGSQATAYGINPTRGGTTIHDGWRLSAWRTRWQPGRSALDLLSQLLRGTAVALTVPPWPAAREPAQLETLSPPPLR